jgi:hypothetical protein
MLIRVDMKNLTFCLVLVVPFWVGCGGSSTPPSQAERLALLPGKVGPSGEVIMVVSEGAWNRGISDVVDSIFGHPVRVLPQYEPRFDVIRLDPSEFDRFWKPHRNIVVFDIADRIDTQEPVLNVYRNRFAKGQIYAEVKARTALDAAEALLADDGGWMLVDMLEQEESVRFGQIMDLDRNTLLEKDLEEKHGLSARLPRDARLVSSKGGFCWIERSLTRMKGGRNHDVQMGVVVHRLPYRGPEDFSMSVMLGRRDSLLRERISSPVEGSYMTTEYRLSPVYEEISFRGGFAATMRGIWRMEGDFMGGPWTSIAWVDEDRGQLVTVDGYVYAPYFGKREYLRELEAIVRSFAPVP